MHSRVHFIKNRSDGGIMNKLASLVPGTKKYKNDPRFKNCVIQEENSPLFQFVMSDTPEQFDDDKCKKSD